MEHRSTILTLNPSSDPWTPPPSSHPYVRGSTKALAANVVPGDTSPLKIPTLLIIKSATFDIGGETVGVVGICIRNKTMGSSRPSPGTILTDEKDAAQAAINALNATGVDKIVLLSHIGYDFDMLLAPLLDYVDVIVGGDSHSLLGDSSKTKNITVTQPDAVYPKMLTNKQGKKVCIVTAWQYANIVGRLEVKFTDTGDVESCTGGPVFLINEEANWIGKTGTSSASVTVPLSVEDKAKVAQSLDANYYVQTAQNPDALQWITENK
jgi:5'-nucleotidase/UDP-sugar diphosphatase